MDARGEGRWRRLRRWLPVPGLILGIAMLVVAMGWTDASERDPKVNVDVVRDDGADGCTVAWTDPWSHKRRQGPFHCDPERRWSPDGDWDVGWVGSYGPWKGDLYNARLEGTAAYAVTDVVGFGGLGIAVLSLGAGAVIVVRARRRRRAALPGEADGGLVGPDAGPPRTLADFPYRVLADTALPGGDPAPAEPAAGPVRGERRVDLRRTRHLALMSQVPQTAGEAALVAGAVALGVVLGRAALPLAIPAVMCAIDAMRRLVILPRRLGDARALEQAANGPEVRPKRYLLLPDAVNDVPVLIFFPPGADGAGLPESMLVVGDSRGLPAVGTAELCSRPETPEIVVPWIAGRPRWPLDDPEMPPYRLQPLAAEDPDAVELLEILAMRAF